MKLTEFDAYLGATICYCQLMENDLKIIYGYMHKGNPRYNLKNIRNNTMGQVILKLEKLDNSDGKPYFTASDYKYLKQVTEKRNHWCHQTFLCFMYEKNFAESKEYKHECKLLLQDYEHLSKLQDKVEFLRLDCVNNLYKRKN